MKKILFILLVIGTIISCEKNNNTSNEEFEDIKNQLLGEWFFLKFGAKNTINFHKNDSLDFIFEGPLYFNVRFLYTLKTKDTLLLTNEDTVHVKGFEIDSAGYLKINELPYLHNNKFGFERKIPCDEVCYDTLKGKIMGKWKVSSSYECKKCNDIYEFKANDSLYYHDYNNSNELVRINKYLYQIYPENYFRIKYSEHFTRFNNYQFHSDTVLEIVSYESFFTDIPSYFDTITLNKIPD